MNLPGDALLVAREPLEAGVAVVAEDGEHGRGAGGFAFANRFEGSLLFSQLVFVNLFIAKVDISQQSARDAPMLLFGTVANVVVARRVLKFLRGLHASK